MGTLTTFTTTRDGKSMAHLACLAHKKRVIVTGYGAVANAYHRSDGAFCVGGSAGKALMEDTLTIGGNVLSLEDIRARRGRTEGPRVKFFAARTAQLYKELAGAVAVSERKPRRRPGKPKVS
jgi:hypothetical protein